MKLIGKVVSISEGKLVVKANDLLKPGTKVFDEAGNFVGIAVNYFGLTKKPYILVSSKKKPEAYRGKEIFA